MRGKLLTIGMMLLLSAAVSSSARAQVATSATVTATATVKKIDKQNRKLWLTDESGKDFEVTVPTSVTRFDQIKTGDRVVIGYNEAMAIAIRKPGQPAPPTGQTQTIERAPG